MALFLTTQQAAAFVGVSPSHFSRAYVRTGKIRCLFFRNGIRRKHMFLRADVEKLKS